jgi:hypothetical protein
MTQQNSLAPSTDSLSQLSARIEAWRNDPQKPRRMPEALWQAAAELSKHSSVSNISKALRLDYTALKKRVHGQNKEDLPAVKAQQSFKFIELDIEKTSSTPECTIEMEKGNGAKMKIYLRGRTDLDLYELGRAFWGKQS